MESTSDVQLSAPPQQPRRSKAFHRRRRKQRVEQLPATLGVVGLIFVTLAAGSEYGYFRYSDRTKGRELADASALDASHRRQLQAFSFNVSSLPVCVAEAKVGNSTYPKLPFDEDEKAASTAFQLGITFFMFIGLAIVCDSFFEASLSAICEAMNLKDDVAGATWMAAGGSAPELATSVLGVFISKSDVGFGTIVGSAVFNVLFVIACCAFVAPNLTLTWWPLARDASYYCFALAVIVIFISDDLAIKHYEAVILLLMYAGYVSIMYFNERLEVWVTARVQANENAQKNGLVKAILKTLSHTVFGLCLYTIIVVNSVMVIVEIVDEQDRSKDLFCFCGERLGLVDLPTSVYWKLNLAFNIVYILEMLVKFYAFGFFGYWKVPLNCFDGSLVFLIIVEWILENLAKSQGIAIGAFRLLRILKFIRIARVLRLFRLIRLTGIAGDQNQVMPENWSKGRQGVDGDAANGATEVGKAKDVEGAPAAAAESASTEKVEEEDDDADDDGPFNPFEVPESLLGKFFWLLGLPLSILMWLTIPDCRRPMFAKWWLGTFAMCIVWIGALAFVMVWMVTEFGINFEIRDSIMGITLLAAGTSIPDCLSSVAVARRGHGDMAVSSSIGSNIFDVLIGLPLPWFMYTAILNPVGAVEGPPDVPILSESLAVMILSLFVMVALVITTIHISGWILSVKLGLMMMALYVLFLILSLLLEFEVLFGPCTNDLLPASGVLLSG